MDKPKQELPSQEEFDEAYYAFCQISDYTNKIYGVPRPTLVKVLKFLYKLGQEEFDRIESLKHEPKFPAPEFPEYGYDKQGNIFMKPKKH
jgi:hypothetical protein